MHSAKHHSRRVLVIDDDLDGMQTLATLLRHMGHEVEFAINGSAGLEAAQRMERSMEAVIAEAKVLTGDLGGNASTSQMGDAVAAGV